MKRFSRAPGARGRIEKPFSNITIIVRIGGRTADAA